MIWKKIIYIMGTVVHLSCATQPMSASLWQRLCSPFARSVESIKRHPVIASVAIVSAAAVCGLYWWKKFNELPEIKEIHKAEKVLARCNSLQAKDQLIDGLQHHFNNLYDDLRQYEINMWIVAQRELYNSQDLSSLISSKKRFENVLKDIRNRINRKPRLSQK